jgi:hypothetical protein
MGSIGTYPSIPTMRITATQIGLGACLLASLTQCQGLAKVYDQTQTRGEKTADIRTGIADDRVEARELAKRSEVALERLKAGCSPIAAQQGYPQPFREGEQVAATNGAPLPEGSFLCNALGWTARVKTIQGVSTMESLALVSPADASKFFELFRSLPGLNPALQPPPTAPQQAPVIPMPEPQRVPAIPMPAPPQVPVIQVPTAPVAPQTQSQTPLQALPDSTTTTVRTDV